MANNPGYIPGREEVLHMLQSMADTHLRTMGAWAELRAPELVKYEQGAYDALADMWEYMQGYALKFPGREHDLSE